MVRLIEDSQQKDRFVERLFLVSIKKWCPDGVECVVSRIGKIFEDKNNKKNNKVKVPITISVLDNMPHIRANVLNEDGQYIMEEDEFEGTKKPKTETIDNPEDVDVTFFHNLALNPKSDPENQEFIVNNKSKLWPLLNFAFIKAGEIKEGNTKTIACTYDELFEVLTSLKFIAKMDSWKIPGGKPYMVLIPEDSIAYADEYDTPVVAEPVQPREPKKEGEVTESPARNMDVEDFDDLDKIPKVHVDYLGKKNPYIKDAVQTLTAGNVPLTSQKLMQELSFMVTDKTMTMDEYNDAKDLVFQTLA